MLAKRSNLYHPEQMFSEGGKARKRGKRKSMFAFAIEVWWQVMRFRRLMQKILLEAATGFSSKISQAIF